MKRWAPLLVAGSLALVITLSGSAQDANPNPCATPDAAARVHEIKGRTFRGHGNQILEPIHVYPGMLISKVEMSEPGIIFLQRPDMESVRYMGVISDEEQAEISTSAVPKSGEGDYFIVAQFDGNQGEWSLTIEQPAAPDAS